MIKKISLFFLLAISLSILYLNEGCNVLKPAPTPTAIPTATQTPTAFKEYYDTGLLLVKQEKYDDAIEYFNKALEVEPNNLQILNDKGNTLYSLGKYNEAIKCYEIILKVEPENKVVKNNKEKTVNAENLKRYMNKGNELYFKKKYTDALSYYEKALEIKPNHVEAWLYKGYSYYCLGKNDIAGNCYDKVLELDPSNSAAKDAKSVLSPFSALIPGDGIDYDSLSHGYVTLIHEDGTDIMGAINEDAFLLMAQAAINQDQKLLKELLKSGYICKIASGTKVKIIEEGESMSKVEILEGNYTGYRLMVFTVSISK